ncbi:hypothetical protein [Pedobacter sp.]|uniref:hypothetical protein n=1 Tax=Pedobacter sp. TaxID=1411316 RepID=UPI00396C9E18
MKNTGNFEGRNQQNLSSEFKGLNYWVNPNVESGEQRTDANENEIVKDESNQYVNLSEAAGQSITQEPLKNNDTPLYFLEYDLDKLDFMD